MTGTPQDAEDIVQEAYLRWHKADSSEIVRAEAWLVTVTTRLSIDRLRVLTKERESYIGPWLPEPILATADRSPEQELEFAASLSLAFVALLENLSPVERAVFLLRDVFDIPNRDVAGIVGKSEAACRQMLHRARERVRSERPRFEASDKEKRRLIETFAKAVTAGDEELILSLFAEDATMTSDGGGRVTSARKPIVGRRKIARLYAILGRKLKGIYEAKVEIINGEPGIVSTAFGRTFAATVFEAEDGVIRGVYQLMNPDKLKNLDADKPN